MKRENIYKRALDTYGELAQKLMLLEEMAELQKEILKDIRNQDVPIDRIIDEFADVEIMLEQLKLIYKIGDKVIKRKKFKKKRLLRRLPKTVGEVIMEISENLSKFFDKEGAVRILIFTSQSERLIPIFEGFKEFEENELGKTIFPLYDSKNKKEHLNHLGLSLLVKSSYLVDPKNDIKTYVLFVDTSVQIFEKYYKTVDES